MYMQRTTILIMMSNANVYIVFQVNEEIEKKKKYYDKDNDDDVNNRSAIAHINRPWP